MGNGADKSSKTAIHINGPVGTLPTGKTGNAMADVIAVEMHLNMFIATGAVKGVSKILFTLGKMNDEFIAAIKAFQRHVVGVSNPDGRVDPNGKTLKFLNGPLDARGGKTQPDEIEIPTNVAAARAQIAKVAKGLLHERGHFLIGAMGDTPGGAGGHPLRPAHTSPATFLDLDHFTKLGPAVNAAWTTHRKFGFVGCMGRPEHSDVKSFNKGIVQPGDPRHAWIAPYMQVIRRMKDAQVSPLYWPGFPIFLHHVPDFERAKTWREFMQLIALRTPGKSEYPRRVNSNALIHLGESCIGIRHYDCIGFVNVVLSKVLRPEWKQSMDYYAAAGSKDLFHIRSFSDPHDLVNAAEEADVVSKDPDHAHIGICVSSKDRIVVIQCRSMVQGLLGSELTPEWKFLARLQAV
jgi:hypothetical protein